MIEPPSELECEQVIGDRPLVACWYVTATTMPVQVNVEKSGVDFAYCRRLGTSIGYEDLFNTELEAIDAGRQLRSLRVDCLNREIAKLTKRREEIEGRP